MVCRRGLGFISLLKCDQAGCPAVMRVLTPCSLGSWACPSPMCGPGQASPLSGVTRGHQGVLVSGLAREHQEPQLWGHEGRGDELA